MWSAVAVGAVVRLALPYKLVMVFSAYRLAEDVAAFVHVPRAGAAPMVLYRMAFAATAPDHQTMVMVNTVCALMILVALPALVARWRPPAGTVATTAWLVALTPALVLDGRTESPLVPAVLWLLTGALLLDETLASGRRRWAVGALVFFALAAQSRPELVAVVPVLGLVVAWRHRTTTGWRATLATLALGWLLLVGPHLLHLRRSIALEQSAGSVPDLGKDFWLAAPMRLVDLALPLQPDLFPVVTTALALAGLALSEGRRLRLALLAVTTGWMLLTVVDLPRTSVPRLHAGAAELLTVVAAWSACAAAARLPWLRARAWLVMGALLWLASAAPGAGKLLARSNEDDTEQFLGDAIAQLPAAGSCVVAIDMGDAPPAHRTQRAFPAYLLRPPHRDGTFYGFEGWSHVGYPNCATGTYLVVDHRCFAMHAAGRAAGISSSPMLASCSQILSAHSWLPVLQRTTPHRGDNEYGYYGNRADFRLGLYRLAAQ